MAIAKPPAFFGSQSHHFPTLEINRLFLKAVCKDLLTTGSKRNKHLRGLFRKIFSETRPFIVFGIGGRDYIWDVAEELGIRYIEVIHAKGYPELTSLFPGGLKVPRELMVFDDLTEDSFLQKSPATNEIHRLTDYWIERTTGSKEREGLLPSFFDAPPEFMKFENRIVVTLQGDGFQGWDDMFETMIADLSGRALWMFRLHPTQLRRPTREFLRRKSRLLKLGAQFSNVDFDFATKVPLPRIMGFATRHLTGASAASYEAAGLGVPTLAILRDVRGYDLRQLAPLKRTGFLEFGVKDADAVIGWITDSKKNLDKAWYSEGQDLESFVDGLTKIFRSSSGP